MLRTLRGGWNAATGRQSLIEVFPIVALRGSPRINLFDVVPSFDLARRALATLARGAPKPGR